jgi:hypothetical protein
MGFEPTTFCMASGRFETGPPAESSRSRPSMRRFVVSAEARATAADHARCRRMKGKNAACLSGL